ncbi:hypothetical protein C8R47DRAFT_1077302 [Mycena vitilis]|nr:hypothetical protein C8R47DRAFT_1077302 [Mycena vitilis]
MSYPQSSYPSASTVDSDLTPAGWESGFPAWVDGTEGQSFPEGGTTQDEGQWHWHSQPSATPTYPPSLDGMDSTYLAQGVDAGLMYPPSDQILDTNSYSSSAAPCHPTVFYEEQSIGPHGAAGMLDATSYAPLGSVGTFVDPSPQQALSASPRNAWENYGGQAEALDGATMLLQFSMSAAEIGDSSPSQFLPSVADASSAGVHEDHWQGQAPPQIHDTTYAPASYDLGTSPTNGLNSFGWPSLNAEGSVSPNALTHTPSMYMQPVRYAPYFRPSAHQPHPMASNGWRDAHFSPPSSASSSPELPGTFFRGAHPYPSSTTTSPRIHSYSLPPSPMPVGGPSVPSSSGPTRVTRRTHKATNKKSTQSPQTEPFESLQWCLVLPQEVRQLQARIQSRSPARRCRVPCPKAGTFSDAKVDQMVAVANKLRDSMPIKCDWDNCTETVAVDKLLSHLRTVHHVPSSGRALCKWGSGAGKGRCDQSMTPMLASGLTKHILSSKHLAGPLPCPVCGKVSYRSDELGAHLRGPLNHSAVFHSILR